MEKNLKFLLIVGARPNFMKIAPLLRAIRQFNDEEAAQGPHIVPLLIHTGQHYDLQMSEIFFRELNIPEPDVNLEVGSGSHAVQTAEIMIRFERICLQEEPDWVIVVGDVNSTMACTLVASKLGIKVAHVEAGLRSFDRTMPEEINRLVTDALADLLLTPSEDADENLLREGIPEYKIKCVGNIMIDSLVLNLEKARALEAYNRYGVEKNAYIFITLHRPANVDDKAHLFDITQNLIELSHKLPIVFPVHPRTRNSLDNLGLLTQMESSKNIHLLHPLGYLETIGLVENARFVLTDSGGLQEETTFLHVPCLTLRPNTERPITITQGTNRLTSLETLPADIERVLGGSHSNGKRPALWDGYASRRILDVLTNYALASYGDYSSSMDDLRCHALHPDSPCPFTDRTVQERQALA